MRPAPREPGDRARRDALHFFSREPVFLIPSGSDRRPWKPRDRVRRDAPHFFSREPLSLIPSGWDRSTGSQEIGIAGGALHFFSREPVFLIPSGWDRSTGSQEIGIARVPCTLFRGNHLPSFLLFHGRRWPHQTFFRSSSSSSSLQRDSGILAVRKTGASVLRLLPPAS